MLGSHQHRFRYARRVLHNGFYIDFCQCGDTILRIPKEWVGEALPPTQEEIDYMAQRSHTIR